MNVPRPSLPGDEAGTIRSALTPSARGKRFTEHPQRYFTDLLTRLVNGWPNSRIDELMPWKLAVAETG